MGKATAELILEGGGSVVLIGRQADRLDLAAKHLNAPGRVTTIQSDIGQLDSLAALQERLDRDHADARYLINGAGVFAPNRSWIMRLLTTRRTPISIGERSSSRRRSHGHGENHAGVIVNIGSMWAKQAVAATPSSAYSMAKAGLHALTQHLAMELAQHNIRVNAVSPAVVETPIYQGFIPADQVHAALRGFDKFHPIGRVGQPMDVARSHFVSAVRPKRMGNGRRLGCRTAA